MRESGLVTRCVKALNNTLHTRAYKTHATRYSRAGEPDILGCSAGFAFAIEVKMPGCRPTELQKKRLEQWRAAGARTGIAYCVADAVAIAIGVRDDDDE